MSSFESTPDLTKVDIENFDYTSGKGVRIGFLLKDSKKIKNKFPEFRKYAESKGFVFSESSFNLDEDISEQAKKQVGGEYNIVFAKFTDFIVKEVAGDKKSGEQLKRWEEWKKKNESSCIVFDSLETQRKLINRLSIAKWLDKVHKSCESLGLQVSSPGFCVFDDEQEKNQQFQDSNGNFSWEIFLKKKNISFPVMGKTIQACGSAESHLMGLVFNENGFKAFKKPFLIQEYWNHDSTVFKAFVIGSEIQLVPRSSLRNFKKENFSTMENIMFDSQTINQNLDTSNLSKIHKFPEEKITNQLVKEVNKQVGLKLFGFDIIQNSETKNWAIIDVNAFPGYKGFKNQHEFMLSYALTQYNTHTK